MIEDKQKEKKILNEGMFGVMMRIITLNLDTSFMIIYKEEDGLMTIKKLQPG